MRIISTILIMICFSTICCAAPVSLNDNLSAENFVQAFNGSKDAIEAGISIKKLGAEYHEPSNTVSTGFLSNEDVLFVLLSKPTGELRELSILVKTEYGEDKAIEILFKETLLAERVLGMPSGEAATNGMFAVIDAVKNGKGSYWSNETNRKYIIRPIKSESGLYIGFAIVAEI